MPESALVSISHITCMSLYSDVFTSFLNFFNPAHGLGYGKVRNRLLAHACFFLRQGETNDQGNHSSPVLRMPRRAATLIQTIWTGKRMVLSHHSMLVFPFSFFLSPGLSSFLSVISLTFLAQGDLLLKRIGGIYLLLKRIGGIYLLLKRIGGIYLLLNVSVTELIGKMQRRGIGRIYLMSFCRRVTGTGLVLTTSSACVARILSVSVGEGREGSALDISVSWSRKQ